MHITFVYISFSTLGRVETLVARMSRWLCDRQHKVTIILKDSGGATNLIDKRVRIVALGDDYETLLYADRKTAKNIALKYDLYRLDVFFALSAKPLHLTLSLADSQGVPCRIFAGNYTLGQYGKGTFLEAIFRPGGWIFRNTLCDKNRIYMNREVKDEVSAASGKEFDGIIWPLPVDGNRFTDARESPVPGKIVSIGRLSAMKEYNLWMIPVIRNLIDSGYNVTWHVYGDGVLRKDMEALIDKNSLRENVFLHGSLNYNQMHLALKDAMIFVGMGTSLIEAGFARVPAIPAIAYCDRPVAYGYLHELPEYNCGERTQMPEKKVFDLVKNIMEYDYDLYINHQEMTLRHVQRFELNRLMEKFLDIIQDTPIDLYQLDSIKFIKLNKFALFIKNICPLWKNLFKRKV